MTTVIATLFVAFLIVAFIYEANRRSTSSAQPPSTEQAPSGEKNLLTADEAMPTQTGRFRARQVLAKSADESRKPQSISPGSESAAEVSQEETPLPDPFFDDKS